MLWEVYGDVKSHRRDTTGGVRGYHRGTNGIGYDKKERTKIKHQTADQ